MKLLRFLTLLLGASLLFQSVPINAQDSGELISNVTINCNFVDTANNFADNVQAYGTKPERWLQIDVAYVTKSEMMGKGSNQIPKWIDNMSIKYELLLPGPKKDILLSGEVTFWAIPLDGKEHHDVAFVHPRFLHRYAPEIKTNAGTAKKIPIKVSFILNSVTIGGGYFPMKDGREVGKLFLQAGKDPEIIRVANSIFGRDKTPWNYLNYDYYELIKSDSQRQ